MASAEGLESDETAAVVLMGIPGESGTKRRTKTDEINLVRGDLLEP